MTTEVIQGHIRSHLNLKIHFLIKICLNAYKLMMTLFKRSCVINFKPSNVLILRCYEQRFSDHKFILKS